MVIYHYQVAVRSVDSTNVVSNRLSSSFVLLPIPPLLAVVAYVKGALGKWIQRHARPTSGYLKASGSRGFPHITCCSFQGHRQSIRLPFTLYLK